jgi:antitoxin ParD1/3/4
MVTMTISLPEQLKDWLDEYVKNGRYATVGEYLGELIRENRARREALVGALIEGEQSGTSGRTVREIAAAAKAKLSNGPV